MNNKSHNKSLIILLTIGILVLGLSFLLPKPTEITQLVRQAKALPPNNELNIIAKANIGLDYDKKLYDETKKAVLKSKNFNHILAFLAINNIYDDEVIDRYENKIDTESKHQKLKEKPSTRDLLLFAQQYDDQKTEKFKEYVSKEEIINDNLLLYYVLGANFFPNYNKLPEPKSLPSKIVYFIFKKPLLQDFFGIRSQSEKTAINQLRKMRPKNKQEKAEKLIALQQQYRGIYLPGNMLDMFSGGLNPIFFLTFIGIPLATTLTLKEKDKKTLFRKESAKLQIKTILLLLVFLQAWFNASAYIAMPLFWRILSTIAVAGLVSILPTKEYFRLKEEYSLVTKNFNKRKYISRGIIGGVLIFALQTIYFVVAIGGPVYVISNLPKETPTFLAIIVFLATVAFAILLQAMLFPYFFGLAMFAKKLKDAELNNRFQQLSQRFGFTKCKILVVPSLGSKLVNAMQTGLFKRNLRIYLFETLLDKENFSEKEMEAVLAHELAHIKKKHILKLLSIFVPALFLMSTIGFFITEKAPVLQKPPIENMLSFLSISAIFLLFLSIQRKFEFQADSLAAKYGYRKELISALDKLHEINLMPKKLPRILYALQSHGDFEARKQKLQDLK